jgi:hypothetical protein
MSVSAVNPTATSEYASIAYDQESLTPEGMMLYLSTRMNEVDGEIDKLFDKQKASQEIRKALGTIQTELSKLNEDGGHDQKLHMPGRDGHGATQIEQNILDAIDKIATINPELADRMRAKMNEGGQILCNQDGEYFSHELSASKNYLDGIIKDLDATAQMDMIRLQSHMSARQTAIQLSTNLIASMSESTKAVVTNIR